MSKLNTLSLAREIADVEDIPTDYVLDVITFLRRYGLIDQRSIDEFVEDNDLG